MKVCNYCKYWFMNCDGVWMSFPKTKNMQDMEAAKIDPLSKAGQRYIQKKSWKAYRNLVHKLTKLQPLHTLDNIDKRGFKDHHVDHKISIWYGWKNNIPAHEIAHISNLRVIPYKDNMRKGTACYKES